MIFFCFTECTRGPELSIHKNILQVHRNSNVSIKCISGPASSGNINTYLKWTRKKDNETIGFANAITKTLEDVHKKSESILDVELLMIERFSIDDVGYYYCEREHCLKKSIIQIVMIGLYVFKLLGSISYLFN